MSLTPKPPGSLRVHFSLREGSTRTARATVSCHATYRRIPDPHRTRTPRPASRDFEMNGTSTSVPGLVTSSRQHSTVNCQPTSRRRRDNPSPAGNPASSGTAGAPCSTDPVSPRSRRTRAPRRSASPTAGAALGRLRSPRSSPVTSSASSSAIPAGRRTSRPTRHAFGRSRVDRRGHRPRQGLSHRQRHTEAHRAGRPTSRPPGSRRNSPRSVPSCGRKLPVAAPRSPTWKQSSSAGWSGPCSRQRL